MTYYTKRNRIRRGSTQSHPKGLFGSTKKKNPFRGIAVPSRIIPKHSRHIDGPRDNSPTFRLRDTALADISFRTNRTTPCVFLP